VHHHAHRSLEVGRKTAQYLDDRIETAGGRADGDDRLGAMGFGAGAAANESVTVMALDSEWLGRRISAWA